MHPLKALVYEIVQGQGNITDTELLSELKKRGVEVSERELNKILLHLEIQGLVSVRWVGKDKKRIELGNRTVRQPQAIW